MYTPGFAAPEMYRRSGAMGPWTDIYAIGACIYVCMTGQAPPDVPKRQEKDNLPTALARLRGNYSDNLLELVQWAMELEPLARPQSVFALHKALSHDSQRRYTQLTMAERVRLQLGALIGQPSAPAAPAVPASSVAPPLKTP